MSELRLGTRLIPQSDVKSNESRPKILRDIECLRPSCATVRSCLSSPSISARLSPNRRYSSRTNIAIVRLWSAYRRRLVGRWRPIKKRWVTRKKLHAPLLSPGSLRKGSPSEVLKVVELLSAHCPIFSYMSLWFFTSARVIISGRGSDMFRCVRKIYRLLCK